MSTQRFDAVAMNTQIPQNLADDDEVVHLNGDETIHNTKTFESPIEGNLEGDVTGNVTIPNGTDPGNLTYRGTELSTLINNVYSNLYPVGAIYISANTTETTCPIAGLITSSTWKKIEGRYLLASGSLVGSYSSENYEPQEEVAAGICKPSIVISDPGHSHTMTISYGTATSSVTAAVKSSSQSVGTSSDIVVCASGETGITASVLSSSPWGNSYTIRPSAYVVNVWLRTA